MTQPILFTGDITTLQRAGYHPHRDCFGVYLLTLAGHLYLNVGDYVMSDNGVKRWDEARVAEWEIEETLYRHAEEMAA